MIPDWLLYIVGAAFLSAALFVLNRFVMRDAKDVLGYGLITQAGAAVLLGLYVWFTGPTWPSEWWVWVLVAVSCTIWTVQYLIALTVDSQADVSLSMPLYRLRLVFALPLSALVFREPVTPAKLAALVLILAGVFITSTRRSANWRESLQSPVVKLLALEAFLATAGLMLDKTIIPSMANVATYGFLLFAIPAVLIYAISKNHRARVSTILASKSLACAAVIVASAFMIVFWYSSLARAVPAQMLLAFEIHFPLAILGGILLLGERDNLKRRALGAVLVLVGSLLAGLA